MLTDGSDGSLPDWYALDRVAQRYHKAPWELPAVPAFWIEKGLIADYCEASARRTQEQRTQ